MKRLGTVLTIVCVWAMELTIVWGQTTYTWTGATTAWATSTNWSPLRTTPATNDILVFDGNQNNQPTISSSETVGRISVTGNTTLTIDNSAGVVTVTLGAGGSVWTVSGGVVFTVTTSSTGTNAGTFAFAGTSPTATISGTLTMTGRFAMGSGSPTITVPSGGTVNVNRSGTGIGGPILGSTTFTVQSGGIVNWLGGGSALFNAGTINLNSGSYYSHRSNSTPSFSGRTYANFELNLPGDQIAVTGGTAVTINNDLVITSGTMNFNMTATPGHAVKGNISVASGATLAFNPASPGTVNLNGSSAQTISGSGTLTTNTNSTLVIDNSNGVSLSMNATANGVLSLTNGLLTLGSSNLTLGSSATISGSPSASNMIVATGSGELRKTFTGTGSFTFPVGDNTGTAEYSPVTLNFTSGSFSSAYAGVKLANSKHPNNTSSTDYINRYWTVSSSGISSFSCDASFVYVAADVEGTESNLYCGSWGGSSWTLLNAVNTGTKTLSGTVSSFSDFTGGETSALPVQLTSFSATANRLDAVLRWATATEVSNYGFEIERRLASTSLSLTSTSLSPTSTSLSLTSTPLSPTSTSLSLTSTPLSLAIGSWMRIGFVEGAGTSNAPRDYSFTDKNVPPGRYAYRIKQIDHDGTFEYFGDAEVEIGLAPKKFTLSEGYPNPFNSTTTIEFTLPEDGRAILSVYNMLGQQVATLFDGETFAGRIMQAKFDASRFPSGIYFSRLEFGGKALTRKIVLMR